MLEKELKILDIDVGQVEKRLKELGAEQTFVGVIHDVYYDFPGDSMEYNKRLFRVRKKGQTHLYTIKRKRINKSEGGEKGLKIADEGEREITDVKSFTSVLEKYGMKATREKKKERISYRLGGIEFDIDIYEGIPPLLEIEAASVDEIKKYIQLLGLQSYVSKSFGSRGLYKYYGLDYSYL